MTSALCPVAGKPGKPVPLRTVMSLTRADHAADVAGREWFYCDLPECDVVYFSADGRLLRKDALFCRVGAKEGAAPRLVCYCFGHTVESIEEEIRRTGCSTVVEAIRSRVKAGECTCATSNPQGRCCLGEVGAVVRAALAHAGAAAAAGPAPAHETAAERVPACCAAPAPPPVAAPPRARRGFAGALATIGAMISALAASACCWLPVLLVAGGVSAAGVAAAFARLRPLFLVLAPLLLGIGFWSVYRRRRPCAGGDCASAAQRSRSPMLVLVWSAGAFVLFAAVFPDGPARLLRGAPRSLPAASLPDAATPAIRLRVDGMTCAACAQHLEAELARVPGVGGVAVEFASGTATVRPAATGSVASSSLLDAVRSAGYTGRVERGE